MISFLARFSAFIVLVMCSFALAFFTLFSECSPDESSEEDLAEAFRTFESSLITVFEAALGQFEIRDFDEEREDPHDQFCGKPPAVRDAGIFIMVLYLIVMAILMMNLLIAILTTAHSTMYSNAEKEFQVTRINLIQKSARGVANGRVPPPLNLVAQSLSLLIDTFGLFSSLWATFRCE